MVERDTGHRGLAPNRRHLLRYAFAAAVTSISALATRPARAAEGLVDLLSMRYLGFLNVHTSEKLAVPFATNGTVVPTAMTAVRQLLHDHHDGSAHDIDPRLLDVLFSIIRSVGGHGDTTIHVVSGYRSPHTNSVLRQTYDGVAANSYHMRGQAIDFWIPGTPLNDLHRAALAVRGGGVGFYPSHNFIHVDVGPVRQWGSFGGSYAVAAGPDHVMVGGRPMHLTPIQARNLAMHRRALLWDRRNRRLF